MIKFYKILVLTSVGLTLSVGAMEQPKDSNKKEQKSFAFNELPVDLQKKIVDNALIDNIFKDIGRLRSVCSNFNNYLRDKEVLKKIVGSCSFLEQYTLLERECLKCYLAFMLTKQELTDNDKQFVACLYDKKTLFELLRKSQRGLKGNFSVNYLNDFVLKFGLYLAFEVDHCVDDPCEYKKGCEAFLNEVFSPAVQSVWDKSIKVDKAGVLTVLQSTFENIPAKSKNRAWLQSVITNYRQIFSAIAKVSSSLSLQLKFSQATFKEFKVKKGQINWSKFVVDVRKCLPSSDKDTWLLQAAQRGDCEFIKEKIVPGGYSGDTAVLHLALFTAVCFKKFTVAHYILSCLPPITIENAIEFNITTSFINVSIVKLNSLIVFEKLKTLKKASLELFEALVIYLKTIKANDAMVNKINSYITRQENEIKLFRFTYLSEFSD